MSGHLHRPEMEPQGKSEDQLPNVKTCALALLTGCEIWLVQPYKTKVEHLNIEKMTALIGHSAYIQ